MNSKLIYKNAGNARLLNMIMAAPGRILDVGCGAGDNAAILAARGWDVTGVTINPCEREAALPYCDEVHLGNLEEGLPQTVAGSFDVVLMSHVLEHLANSSTLLADVRGRLNKDGVIAVALPNVLNYNQRLRFLMGDFTYTDTGILDRTHVRFYTYTTGRKFLEDHGFAVLEAAADGWLPLWRLRDLVPTKALSKLDEWALKLRPDLFGYQSLFIAYATK